MFKESRQCSSLDFKYHIICIVDFYYIGFSSGNFKRYIEFFYNFSCTQWARKYSFADEFYAWVDMDGYLKEK